jgi:hypothetical protein
VIGPVRRFGDLLKAITGDRILTFLEHEYRDA